MNYWLVKTKPNDYSLEGLVELGRNHWDGARNYVAGKHMKNMKVGVLTFFYHSVKQRGIVGVAEMALLRIGGLSDQVVSKKAYDIILKIAND